MCTRLRISHKKALEVQISTANLQFPFSKVTVLSAYVNELD